MPVTLGRPELEVTHDFPLNTITSHYSAAEVKNLGLYITHNLSWDAPITQISKRMYGTMHSLKRIKNFLSQSTRVILVNTLLLPILGYADACDPDATE